MTANVMVIVERQFDYPRPVVFRAWTAPDEMAEWRGSPGWHVEKETVSSELRLGGKHHHVKVRDNDPTTRVTTDAVFTEYFDPDVFVARQRITGDPGIDPDRPAGAAGRVHQDGPRRDAGAHRSGPLRAGVAGYHGEGWERELTRLQDYLDRKPQEVTQ